MFTSTAVPSAQPGGSGGRKPPKERKIILNTGQMPDTINNIKYRATIVDGCLNGTHLLQNLLETVPLTLLERPPLLGGPPLPCGPPARLYCLIAGVCFRLAGAQAGLRHGEGFDTGPPQVGAGS